MANTGITRFGVSINEQLLKRFDDQINEKGYNNRSEAIRALIRNSFVEGELSNDAIDIVGSISLVYDHHIRDLAEKLTDHQHSYSKVIISALHVLLDAHHYLEIIVVKGQAEKIRKMADELIGTRGVKHGKLMLTTSGKNLT